MAALTRIEWADSTFNPWRGCTKVSPACDNCYAATMSKRNPQILGQWGDAAAGGTRVVAAEKQWREPLKWNAAAARDSSLRERPRVFCASLADVFEDWTGEMRDSAGKILHRCRAGHVYGLDAIYAHGAECESGCNRAAILMTMADVRRRLFALIDATPNLDWLLLTKRPKNIARMMPRPSFDHAGWNGTLDGYWHQVQKPRSNVWLGTTVENQEQADARIPHLLTAPAAVRFLSVEPLLGPLNLNPWLMRNSDCCNAVMVNTGWCCCCDRFCRERPKPDWVIAGGESGPGARPSHPDWFRSVRDQCTAAGVPFFFKQWGDWASPEQVCAAEPMPAQTGTLADATLVWKFGKAKSGRLLDGREWNEFPSVNLEVVV